MSLLCMCTQACWREEKKRGHTGKTQNPIQNYINWIIFGGNHIPFGNHISKRHQYPV